MKTVQEIKGFITEKVKEAEFKVNYATELFSKLNLPESSLTTIIDDIAENKGIIKAYSELNAFIDTIPCVTQPRVESSFEKSIPIAFKLYTARVRMRKTQKEMAKLIGVDGSTVSNWEAGNNEPKNQYKIVIESLYKESEKILCDIDLCKSPIYKKRY